MKFCEMNVVQSTSLNILSIDGLSSTIFIVGLFLLVASKVIVSQE